MKAIMPYVVSLGILVLFPILGAYIGFKVGYSIDFPSSKFTPWELLVSPVDFEKFVALNDYGVWAQTTKGEIYVWDFEGCQFPATCHQWAKVNNTPGAVNGNGQLPANESRVCAQGAEFPTTEPPGKVVDCVSIGAKNGPSFSNYYYALLADGTIWRWVRPAVNDFPILTILIYPSIGIVLGLITSGPFIYLIMKRHLTPSPNA